MKKIILRSNAVLLILGLLFSTLSANTLSSAKAKPKLTKTNLVLRIGDAPKKIRIKNTVLKKNVKWNYGNSNIIFAAFGGKHKSYLSIRPNHPGKTSISATVNGKKLKCNIIVKHSKIHEKLKIENALNTNWPKADTEYKMCIHEKINSDRTAYFQGPRRCSEESYYGSKLDIGHVFHTKMKLSWSYDKKYTVISFLNPYNRKMFSVTLDGPDKKCSTGLIVNPHKGTAGQHFILSKTGRKYKGHTTFYLITTGGYFVSMYFGLVDDAINASEIWLE